MPFRNVQDCLSRAVLMLRTDPVAAARIMAVIHRNFPELRIQVEAAISGNDVAHLFRRSERGTLFPAA
jgi:hypothetical protein